MWKLLFPDTTATYNLTRWHDPAPDTNHLGLSPVVSARLWDQHQSGMEGVIKHLGMLVARAAGGVTPPVDVNVGMVCRSRFPAYVS